MKSVHMNLTYSQRYLSQLPADRSMQKIRRAEELVTVESPVGFALFSHLYLNPSREIVVVAVVVSTVGGVGEVGRVQLECGDGNSMD